MAVKRTKRGARPRTTKSTVVTAQADDCSCCQPRASASSYALLFLRLVLAAVFLWAGITQILDLEGTRLTFAALGLWDWLGPVLAATEVVGGAVLLLGFWTRSASACTALLFICTLVLSAAQNGFTTALFVPLLGLAGALIVATAGPGAWALDVPTCRCEGACQW